MAGPGSISVSEAAALAARLPQPEAARALAVLPQVARRWLEPADPFRRRALEVLPATTGYAAGFIASGLDHVMAELAHHLQDWVDAELPSGWRKRPGLGSRWAPPRLTLCTFAGNVPGVPAPDIAGCLAIGSAVLCKVAAGEPAFTPLFIESIAAVDPVLAESAAAVYWPGSSTDHLDAVLPYAEAVIAYGSDESVGAVRARVKPGMPFLGYGHRLSFAVVGEGAPPDAAARAAFDVAAYDQQGCVSPHVIYVLGDAHAFASQVSAELEGLQRTHPRAPVSLAEAAAIRRVRDEAEFKEGAVLYASPDTAWTVVYDEADRAYQPSPLGRTVRVHPIRALDELPALLAPVRRYLQTCAFGGAPADAERLAALLGACRICPLGKAQYPPISWHHDGQPTLSRLVRWVDIEY